MKPKYFIIAFILSLILSFVLYARSLSGGFVYDDNLFVNRPEVKNISYISHIIFQPQYISTTTALGTYRPITMITFALNFLVLGGSPFGFHVVNSVLNGIAIFLVFVVIYKLFKNTYLAILTALLFGLFPIHTEAVAFIKARDEILGCCFILLSWIVFIKSVYEREKINYILLALSSIFYLMSVLSKEFMVNIPFLFIVVYWIQKNGNLQKIMKISWMFCITLIVYLSISFKVLILSALGRDALDFIINPLQKANGWERIWTAFSIFFLYVQKIIFPFNLSATYEYNHLPIVSNPLSSISTLLGIILSIIAVIILFNKKLRNSPLGIGTLIFFVPYTMYSKLILRGGDIFGERWVYFSSLGIALILGYFFMVLYKKSMYIAIAAIIIVCSVYSFIVIERNAVWLTEETLYKSMIVDAPDSIQGYIGMAYWYVDHSDYKNALPYVIKSKTIYANHPRLLNLEAAYAIREGNYKKAKSILQTALKVLPSASNYLLYSFVLAKEGNYKESLRIAQNYFSSPFYYPGKVNNNSVFFLLAVDYYKMGNKKEAQKYFNFNPQLSLPEKIKVIESF
jgi:hypothetical protein